VFPPSDRLRRLWRPPVETMAGMAAVVREHWRAAARMRPARVFWPTPGRWLKAGTAMAGPVNVSPVTAAPIPGAPVTVAPVYAAPLTAAPLGAPVTTSPGGVGSSDTLQDPHPY